MTAAHSDTLDLEALRRVDLTLLDGSSTTLGALLDSPPGGAAPVTALLVVNVASKCGFTPQYAGLETLWRTYRDRGLLIVGLPCDQFLKQEFSRDAAIAEFCSLTYGVSFPLLSKGKVRGRGQHALFGALLSVRDSEGTSGMVLWNFEKFLVDLRTGGLRRWRSKTEPLGDEMRGALEALVRPA
ncbi:glutathione peroxidase [Micrococcales bacterium 31B]|nr:glutathione peroxidase [Micrococcales bacterium 31B]